MQGHTYAGVISTNAPLFTYVLQFWTNGEKRSSLNNFKAKEIQDILWFVWTCPAEASRHQQIVQS